MEPFSLQVQISLKHPGLNPYFCLLLGSSSCISTSGVLQEPDFAFRYSHANEDQFNLHLKSWEKDFALSFIDYSPVIMPCIFQSQLIYPFLSDFYTSLKKVLSNRMYFTFLCCSLLQFNSFIGFLTYKPKYMEQQYGQSTSKSNFLIGELHSAMTAKIAYVISSV